MIDEHAQNNHDYARKINEIFERLRNLENDLRSKTQPSGGFAVASGGGSSAGGGDSSAIHTNIPLEINALTHVGSLASGDEFILEDATSSLYNKKKCTPVTLMTFLMNIYTKDEDAMGSNSALHWATQQSIKAYVDAVSLGALDAIHDNVAGEIAALTPVTGDLNGDMFLIEDFSDSNNKKKITMANVNATLALNNMAEKAHASLSGVSTSQHHVKYALATDNNEINALDHIGSLAIADSFVVEDGSASDAKKKCSAVTIMTYFMNTYTKDEDDMASDSSSQWATQQSIKAYVDVPSIIGVANASKFPMHPNGMNYADATHHLKFSSVNYYHVSGTGVTKYVQFVVAVPAQRNGLTFYVTGADYYIVQANGSNYTDEFYISCASGNNLQAINTYSSTRNSAGAVNLSFTAVACTYDIVRCRLKIIQGTSSYFRWKHMSLTGYYA